MNVATGCPDFSGAAVVEPQNHRLFRLGMKSQRIWMKCPVGNGIPMGYLTRVTFKDTAVIQNQISFFHTLTKLRP